MKEEKPTSPGYLWRPGSSPQDNPLVIVVVVVIAAVLIDSVVLGFVVAQASGV